ncbi:glycosyltransferase family 2 protein [Dyadobacter sediminis]|uniref:Glycosyltransferase n=1 Tax=Dyadobacter sediminis TaxID=1493691 RepID=A0A5R9KA64_9BACT|nr:glycosyltransferase family 2 protein [Dyadobacter sediminis]TLU91649.1 glycosyltransferase [Dyadobacter sediminis]GGC01540.1 glycosyl transferase [Dyadobacter sediminis]
MNETPQLTIITITYNAERFLERTLKSVEQALQDTERAFETEYLIIDGNSTDGTLQIAAKYKPIISRIVSEPDRGLYDAMNKGLARATGKYIWFLNAGDEIYNVNVLEKLFLSFESQADVYYSDAMLVKDDGSEVGLRSRFTPHDLPKNLKWQDFAFGMKVCHQAFIAKREIAPYYDDQNLSADIDWEIQILKRSDQVQYLDFLLCKYLMGGISVKNHRRSLMDRFHVLRKHFGLFPALFNHVLIFQRGFQFARRNGRYW